MVLAVLLGMLLPISSVAGSQPVILDTDLSSDVDDVGAVAVLHALADDGTFAILATMISSGDPWSGPCLNVLNASFGRPEIPVGVISGPAVTHSSKYTRHIVERFQSILPQKYQPHNAQLLYRKLLAGQPDHSVTIVAIGYLSNLEQLLKTSADEHSPLDGVQLVAAKVRKLVCMGGQYPVGKEWNFYQDPSATAYTLQQWPTQITLVGFEIGRHLMTGKIVRRIGGEHPLKEAYQCYNGIENRESWDQSAVLVAASSDDPQQLFWSLSSPGTVRIERDGSNRWTFDPHGRHHYVIWNGKSYQLTAQIEQAMLRAVDYQH